MPLNDELAPVSEAVASAEAKLSILMKFHPDLTVADIVYTPATGNLKLKT